MQPEPVPKSKIFSSFLIKLSAISTTFSVSCLGIKTPFPTLISAP